jgi:type IV pilus assembly protein PilC
MGGTANREVEMQYKYVAYNKGKQIVNGKVDAPNQAVAQEMLDFSGLKTVSLKEWKPLLDMNKIRGTTYKIKNKEIIMFSKQLALMIESGFDIAASLDLLESQIGDRNLKRVVGEITADIRNGLKPSQAFAKHPEAFTSLYCRTIAVAEETGNLEKALRQMAEHIEKNANASKKVKSALMYPAMTMVLGIIVVLVMVLFIVPTFKKMYDTMGADIPMTAQILLSFTDFVRAWGLFMLVGAALAAVAAYAYTRSEKGKYQRDALMLRMPLMGKVIILSELSRVAATISTLFKAGVPLPEVMTLASQSCENRVIAKALTDVRQEMLQGQGLARPMSQRAIFPSLLVQMASVGENTGNLDSTMDTVAMSYGMEAEDKTAAMTSLIAPIMGIGMGGMVGFLAMAMMQTMYGMMGQL